MTEMAWHFVGDTLRDGRPIPPDGEWLTHDGEIVICSSGLHASPCLIDALAYAPGDTLCLVECEDVRDRHSDKLVCARRRIAWRIDATDLLRRFARKFALDVLHLWDAPAVVREYLETGREDIRGDARAAAWAAAWNAAGAMQNAWLEAAAHEEWHRQSK